MRAPFFNGGLFDSRLVEQRYAWRRDSIALDQSGNQIGIWGWICAASSFGLPVGANIVNRGRGKGRVEEESYDVLLKASDVAVINDS
jgi:hypothetical protein